jgi:hypothetical protein
MHPSLSWNMCITVDCFARPEKNKIFTNSSHTQMATIAVIGNNDLLAGDVRSIK